MSRLLLFAAPMEMEPALDAASPAGWEVECVGVGPIAAAVGTIRAVAKHAPEDILYLGTCGCYPGSELTIGDVVTAETLLFTSGEIVDNRARIPHVQPSMLRCARFDSEESIRSVTVVCTIGVTEEEALAERLASVGHVENLEIFSVRFAAKEIPVRAILGVSNAVGPDGGREWMENHAEVMKRVAIMAFGL